MNDEKTLSKPKQKPIFYAIINRADLAESTKKKYIAELEKLVRAQIDPRNAEALQLYAATLPASRQMFLQSALKIQFAELARRLKQSATPENLPQIQAALLNIEAMDTISVKQDSGRQVGIRLSPAKVHEITGKPNKTTRGRRDYIILAVLFGAGLRVKELANLTTEQIKTQPRKDGTNRTILEVTGKGNKTRAVPISNKLAAKLNEWIETVGAGHIARSITKGGTIGKSMSENAVRSLVKHYGKLIKMPDLSPHDCRRTFARIGYDSGVGIVQIQTLLGHKSIETTKQYIGLDLDIEQTASDFIKLA